MDGTETTEAPEQPAVETEASVTEGDRTLNCVDCGQDFTFSKEDQDFHAKQNPPFADPKRCKPCRKIRKQKFAGKNRK